MTQDDYQTLADLLDKGEKIGLTDQEQALLNELLVKERSQLSPEESETLLKAARHATSIAPGSPLHARVRKCGLKEGEIDFYRDMWIRLDANENDASITPEQRRKFEALRHRIDLCLTGGGGGDPPDSDSGPDDSGPSITDALGVQPVEDDADEAEPTPSLPVQEPVPVQILPALKPEDKKKTKPRTRLSRKRSGVDFP